MAALRLKVQASREHLSAAPELEIREVGQIELPKGELKIAPSVIQCNENGSMFVPFVSGSAKLDAMVIIPASMLSRLKKSPAW